MLFDLAQTLPEPGSPLEILWIMVWFRREETKFQSARANLQALLSQQGAEDKTIMEAFEDLKQCFFPYLGNQKEEQKKQMLKILDRERARGPLTVTPQVDMFRAKIASRLDRGDKLLKERLTLRQEGRLTDLDSQTKFQSGRRRHRGAF